MINKKIKSYLINDFSIQVRNYALAREMNVECSLPSINEALPKLAGQLKKIISVDKYFIRDYLSHKDWAYIIYLSYFTFENGESILLKNFPVFKETNSVKRGGLNLYKRDGWCTHVITGLFISNICIPERMKPLTIPIRSDEMKEIFNNELPKLFSQLDTDDLLLYRIGTLIHDLGVLDGVENHDYKGIKYVKPALIELGINSSWLLKNNYTWKLHELIFALELFVGQHSFLSKVYSEFGLDLIRHVLISEFTNSEIKSEFLSKWLNEKSLLTLSLFIIGDIGAVRDELLNLQTLKKIIGAEKLLNKLLNEHNTNSNDFEKYGLNRLKDFLEIEKDEIIIKLLEMLSLDNRLFLINVGRIQRLDYFLTYIKQLKKSEDRIIFMYRLTEFLNDIPEWKKSMKQELNFSPHVSIDLILSICNKENIEWKSDMASHLKVSVDKDKVIAKFDE